MEWFLFLLLLGSRRRDRREDRELVSCGPCYTMSDRPRIRADRKPPGVLGWCLTVLFLMGATLAAPSCMMRPAPWDDDGVSARWSVNPEPIQVPPPIELPRFGPEKTK